MSGHASARTPSPHRVDHRDEATSRRIHGLLRTAYAAEAVLIGAPSFPPLARTPAAVRGSSNEFIGYEIDGRLVGVLELERSAAPELSIASLGVDPGYARRGIGTALVQFVLSQAQGPVRVATAAANAPAIELYRRAGFRPGGNTLTPEGIRLLHLQWGPVE